ncbi:MAG: non-hydrolyzing UDP-N-acetylglucosamine 2-epimerase [Acidimicrobiales bacterium]
MTASTPAAAPPKRLLVAFGTRPEIVKLAPVVRALWEAGHEVRTLATGQHDDAAMTDSFFADLGLVPDERFHLVGESAERLGAMTTAVERELDRRRPDLVLLLGDTNTVPVVALSARRHRVPVAHLEAGLRSFNATSMEEVNRKVAAACASLHLAPTELAARFLRDEGVHSHRIEVVGNPVVDVLIEMGLDPLPPARRSGTLVTAHRATNVDDPVRLSLLVDLVLGLAQLLGPVVFPLHPRTRSRLEATGLLGRLAAPGVDLRVPLPYGEMLGLLRASRVVVTDSGGVQEEASYFGVPAVVLRRSTPRWESVELSISRLVGLDVDAALEAASRFAEEGEQARVAATPCPYGDGQTSKRVARLLAEEATWELLRLEEPGPSHLPEALAAGPAPLASGSEAPARRAPASRP